MATVTVKIEGLDRLLRRAEGRYLLGSALRGAFERTGYAVAGRAKELAPVDRGQLRAGITHQVDPDPIPVWVIAGTRNIPYAKDVHDGRKPGKWPPIKAIAAWAKRKGIDAPPFVIARAIARKGTKAQPYLADAMTETEPKIQGYFDGAAQEIERRWQT